MDLLTAMVARLLLTIENYNIRILAELSDVFRILQNFVVYTVPRKMNDILCNTQTGYYRVF